MKKNRIFILGIVTMFVAILSLTLVSGTLARYTSSKSGSDVVQVAKWDVEYNAEGGGFQDVHGTPDSLSFQLFKDTVCYDEAGEDVVAGKIAPGTKGSFSFTLRNSSDVTAEYDVSFTTTNPSNIPIKWSLEENGTYSSDIATLSKTNQQIAKSGGQTEAIVIYWQWAFESGDNALDTQLGIDQVDLTVTINVTFDQVD